MGGAARLDEPTLNPSDPSILDLQLRSLSKNRDIEPIEVRCIQNADKFPKEIENWVKNIDDLNRSKPAPTVQYSRRMPDIEQLMQVWPSELEEFLSHNSLPELHPHNRIHSRRSCVQPDYGNSARDLHTLLG